MTHNHNQLLIFAIFLISSIDSGFFCTTAFTPIQPTFRIANPASSSWHRHHSHAHSTVITTSSSLTDEDFAEIPRLEEELRYTLIPSPLPSDEYIPCPVQQSNLKTNQDEVDNLEIPLEETAEEVYRRLSELYGFPNFNYGANGIDRNAFEKGKLSTLPQFEKIRVLHIDPLILQIDEFFNDDECQAYIDRSLLKTSFPGSPPPLAIGQSRTIDQESESSMIRTSSTWFHHYCGAPELMAKASRLLGLDYDSDGESSMSEIESVGVLDRWEEPQTVRYQPTQKFTWHYDAFDPRSDHVQNNGGQRVATLLVYLTDVEQGTGGATLFRDLGVDENVPLRVQPQKGSAILFFPSLGGIPTSPIDVRLAHCGEAVKSDSPADKWIAQLWLCEGLYEPSAPRENSKADGMKAMKKWSNGTSQKPEIMPQL